MLTVLTDGQPKFKLNGTTVTFMNRWCKCNYCTNSIKINSVANTFVVANTTPTIANSDASGTAYGLVGGYVPFSAYIDMQVVVTHL